MELWEEDLYEILGVDDDAAIEDIRKAYKKLAIELHPDRFPDDAAKREDATHRFGKITNAYNILKDEEERAEYDFARRIGFAGGGGPPAASGGKPAGGAATPASGGSGPIVEDDGISEARRGQAENQFALGKIAHKAKQWAKSIQHYKEAARLDPNNSDYHAYLGLLYKQQGLKAPAQKAFEQAYKLDKKNPLLKGHYDPPGDKKKGGGGGGLFAQIMALFSGGGKKEAAKGGKGKKDVKGGKGKKAAGKR